VLLEELEDGEDDVVDIAKPRGLALLGVVQPTGPIDGDVVGGLVELDGGTDGGAGVGLAEGVEAVEDGAVLADVEPLEGAEVIVLGVGGDGAEEGDVVVGVEAAEIAVTCRVGPEHVHAAQQAVVVQEGVGHADAVGLHRVALPVVVVAHLGVVEVADAALRRVGGGGGGERVAAGLHCFAGDGSSGGVERGRRGEFWLGSWREDRGGCDADGGGICSSLI